MGSPDNPCVRLCCLDEEDICGGCGRTLKEIIAWHHMSDREKHTLLTQLKHQENEEASESTSIRCFLGIELSSTIMQRLQSLTRPLKPASREHYRWQPPQSWHLTLHFLGNVNRQTVESLEKSLKSRTWLPQPMHVQITQTSAFPGLSAGKYIIADIADNPELRTLHQELGKQLSSFNIKPDERAFRPHITLARLRRRHKPIPLNHVALDLPMSINEFSLIESRLSPIGARYLTISRFH